VLVVTHDTVRVNGQPARTGRIVCDGDEVTTDASGVADVIVSGDRDSDSIHLAESTDPRLRWTAARCVSIENFRRGTINVSSRRLCMVVRTRDVLMYQPANSRAQYVVRDVTEVKSYFGAVPVKLQALPESDVRQLSSAQLLQRRASPTTQPQSGSLNVYRAEGLVQPPRQLTPVEIRSIETMRLRGNPKIIRQ
jgi:hypothetical protein